jgi:hypothetical protein
VEIFVRKLKTGDFHPGQDQTKTIMGGSAKVIVTDIDKSSATKPDSLKMVTIATYEGLKDTVVNILTGNISVNTPDLTGAMSVSYGSKANLKTSNSATLDGHNYDINGVRDSLSCPDVHGLTYGRPGDVSYTTSGNLKINGVGSYIPDTFAVTTQPDYYQLALQLEQVADRVIPNGTSISKPETLGTISKPQITYCKGSVSFSQVVTGAGILIVDGKFNASNTVRFTGVIMCVGDSLSKQEMKVTNADNLVGAIIMCGTNVKFNSTNVLTLKYSCEAINMAFNMPKLMGNYVVCDWWE